MPVKRKTALGLLLLLAAATLLTPFAAAAPEHRQDPDTCTLTISARPMTFLEVRVSPPDIDGRDWGMTDFDLTYHYAETVTITAPMRAAWLGLAYSFAHWDVDGVTEPAEESTFAVGLALTMDDDHTVTAHYQPESFPDVPADHWAYPDIMACWTAYVVQGYPDGLYRPELVVTRDQMAVFIARRIPQPSREPDEPTFPDVPPDHWAYGSIEECAAESIVEGYPDGKYHPEWNVTRGQMAVFIARGLASPRGEEGLADYEPPDSPTVHDVPRDYWCFRHVEFLAEYYIVEGYPGGTYQPAWLVTRDQIAVYIARAFIYWRA